MNTNNASMHWFDIPSIDEVQGPDNFSFSKKKKEGTVQVI